MTRPRVNVDFFADLSCPWCYVSWAALKLAAAHKREEIAAAVAWRSFLLAPDMPLEGVDRKQYLEERYSTEGISTAHKTLEDLAGFAGVPINLDAATRLPNTIDAHRVIMWAASYRLAERMIDALFHAYFVEGRDLGAADVLIAAAEQVGMDPHDLRNRLAGDSDREAVLNQHRAGLQIGLRGVPAAIFNRRTPLMGAQTMQEYALAMEAATRA
jgi:predicted DsbA family dithiol-disulfide isomerase